MFYCTTQNNFASARVDNRNKKRFNGGWTFNQRRPSVMQSDMLEWTQQLTGTEDVSLSTGVVTLGSTNRVSPNTGNTKQKIVNLTIQCEQRNNPIPVTRWQCLKSPADVECSAGARHWLNPGSPAPTKQSRKTEKHQNRSTRPWSIFKWRAEQLKSPSFIKVTITEAHDIVKMDIEH